MSFERRQIPSFSELLRACSIKVMEPPRQVPYHQFQNVLHCYPSPPQTEHAMEAPKTWKLRQAPNWNSGPPSLGGMPQNDAVEQRLVHLLDMEKRLMEKTSAHTTSPALRQRLVNYHRYAVELIQESLGPHMQHKLQKPLQKRKRTQRVQNHKKAKVIVKDDDHGSLSFTVKPIEAQNYHVSRPYQGRHYLNKELSVKNNTLCSQCGSTKTPEWRSGPQGCRTLCNACGLFFTKVSKRMGTEAAQQLLAERKKVGTPLDRRICI